MLVLFSTARPRRASTSTLTDDLVGAGRKAGDLVNRIAALSGGKGGGRPHFASAGAGDPTQAAGRRVRRRRELVSAWLGGRRARRRERRLSVLRTGWSGRPAGAPRRPARARAVTMRWLAAQPTIRAEALAAAAARRSTGCSPTPGDRSVALDLLAADALVTLALLAQAQQAPERLGALRRRAASGRSGPPRDRPPLPSAARRWTTARARSEQSVEVLQRDGGPRGHRRLPHAPPPRRRAAARRPARRTTRPSPRSGRRRRRCPGCTAARR